MDVRVYKLEVICIAQIKSVGTATIQVAILNGKTRLLDTYHTTRTESANGMSDGKVLNHAVAAVNELQTEGITRINLDARVSCTLNYKVLHVNQSQLLSVALTLADNQRFWSCIVTALHTPHAIWVTLESSLNLQNIRQIDVSILSQYDGAVATQSVNKLAGAVHGPCLHAVNLVGATTVISQTSCKISAFALNQLLQVLVVFRSAREVALVYRVQLGQRLGGKRKLVCNLSLAVQHTQKSIATLGNQHHLATHSAVNGHLSVGIILCKIIQPRGIALGQTEFLVSVNLRNALHCHVTILVDGCCIQRFSVPPSGSVFHSLCLYATNGAQAQYCCQYQSFLHTAGTSFFALALAASSFSLSLPLNANTQIRNPAITSRDMPSSGR